MLTPLGSLTTVTSLPAYELAEYCYYRMFTFCLSLTNLPELPTHLQSSVFKLSKDLIDSIHEEGIVAYTS